MNIIKHFDWFRKPQQDIETHTSSGGFYSIIGIVIAFVLFVKEYQLFKEPIIEKEFLISPLEADNIQCYFNVTFFHAPCQALSLDYQDENSGDHKSNIPLKKIRISEDGDIIPEKLGVNITNYQGSDKELQDFAQQVQRKEACRYEGQFSLKKSPGNFHISFHARQDLVDKLKNSRKDLYPTINLDHQINELYFGNYGSNQGEKIDQTVHKQAHMSKYMFKKESKQEKILREVFKFNKTEYAPYNKIVFLGDQKYDYENYIKILPIKFEYPNIKQKSYFQGEEEMEKIQELYQFSMASTKIPKMGNEMTSVFFRYQVSPLNLTYTLKYQKVYHFIVQILAIIGGIIAVLGIIASGTEAFIEKIKKSINRVHKEFNEEAPNQTPN